MLIVLSYLTDFGYQGPSSECHSLCCGSVLTNVYSTSKYRENAVNASIKMDKNSIIVRQSVTCEGLFVPMNLQVLFGYKNYDSTWLLVFIIDTVCKLCTP